MENLNKEIERTKYESHLNIIGRFALTVVMYILGMCITLLIFFLMLSNNDLMWAINKIILVGSDILLFLIAAKVLKVFKPEDEVMKTSRLQHNIVKYPIMYALVGFVFSLVAVGLIGACYFFIGAFAGLKVMGHFAHWSDGFVVLIMPVVLAVTTIALFVIAGAKFGKKLCR